MKSGREKPGHHDQIVEAARWLTQKEDVMAQVFIASTEIIIDGLFKFQHDRHVQDYRMHVKMFAANPDYEAEIATRQAAKRAAGIGPEGMCLR